MDSGQRQVHSSLTLFVLPDKFYLQPSGQNELMVVDRVTEEITLEVNVGQVPETTTGRLIHGIFGIIHLLSGLHLIVITRISKVGDVFGQSIFRIDDTEILSLKKATLHLTEEQIQYNQTYLSMVKTVLDTPYFYLSYSYDLTHSLQRLYNAGPDFVSYSLFERADSRFVWNRNLLKHLSNRPEFSRYCIPVIHGFVSINIVTINRKIFTWSLISRRSVFRAGTRLFIRGVDKFGNSANFVETEQMVEFESSRSSFVQIRGSIPLFWSQLPNLRYKPPPKLAPNVDHFDAFKKHIDQIIEYGKISIVNLINRTGSEQVLGKALAEMINKANYQFLKYEPFDFHHECRKMRWDRLSLLLDSINSDQADYSYFAVSADKSLLNLQEGVFRTNCIDSLDRTNVVQKLIALRSLEDQLTKFSILHPGEKLLDHSGFYYLYRNVWADNADICSIQYAGTGALKTDFTRTGKRSTLGAIKDGINSLIRYYKNNFADGYRQDAIDLFLGNYQVDENEGRLVKCPLQDRQHWKYLALPLFFLMSIAMFFFSLLVPAEHSTETLFYLLFWFAMVSITLTVMLYYGAEFADYPKLSDVKQRKKND